MGTRGLIDRDYVGASHEALVGLLESHRARPLAFLDALIAAVRTHGATHNQRALIRAADEILRAPPLRPVPVTTP